MKTKIEIRLLKEVDEIQKIDRHIELSSKLLNLSRPKEQKGQQLKSQLSDTTTAKEKILKEFSFYCILPSEAISINYNFLFSINTLTSTKDKLEVESLYSINKEDSNNKQMLTNPCLMYYYITSSFEKNIVKNDKLNTTISISKNCFINHSTNNFYLIGWGRKMYIATISKEHLYVLNFDFIIVKIISIKRIKKLNLKKKADVIFQYDERKQNKCISLMSIVNRRLFIEELLESNSNIVIDDKEFIIKNYSKFEREYQKRFLLKLFEENKSITNKNGEKDKLEPNKSLEYVREDIKFQIVRKMVKLFKEQCPNSFYKYEVTYNSRKSKLCNMGKLENGTFKTICLLPYIYNQEIVSKIFSLIYFNYNNLNCDFSNNKKYKSYLKISFSMRKRISRIEMTERKKKEEVLEMKGIKNRPRKEIEKRRKKNLIGKCVYSNIVFKVTNVKNSKCTKDLVVSTGKFVVKKDKENDKVS